jgi:hypothetical protein
MRRAIVRGGLRRAPLVLLAAAVLAAAACGGGGDAALKDGTPSATMPSAPAVLAPSVEPAAPPPPRRPPAAIDGRPGEVRVEEGPFTDRIRVAGLVFTPGPRPSVRGRLVNRVDVSELIVLELQADFYDAVGRYLGSGRRVFRDAHADPAEGWLVFRIRASAPQPEAVSALLSVPQLVNE